MGWVLANILASQLKIKFSTRNKVNKIFQLKNDYLWSKYLFYFNILSWLYSQKSETQDFFVHVTKNNYPAIGENRICSEKEGWGRGGGQNTGHFSSSLNSKSWGKNNINFPGSILHTHTIVLWCLNSELTFNCFHSYLSTDVGQINTEQIWTCHPRILKIHT